MRRVIFIVLCCFTILSSLFSKKFYTSTKNIFLINTVEAKNSFISYVTIDGHKYIVKQKKDITKKISIVRDALAAYIAKKLFIAHSVKIISSKKNFPGKVYPMEPGAILTIAPGATIRDQPESKYYSLCLKQRNINGELLPDRWLTENIIYQITWHWQLPIIIGLDLFICNTDRHKGNLFYDPQTDSFCAIDMDNIFRRNLPGLAYEKLNIMINNKKQFTHEEIEALISVRDTLQFLLNKYKPKRLIAKLHHFAKKAGLKKGSFVEVEKIKRRIAEHEEMIIQSRASVYKLIAILNKIINSF
jgi:hypothetical protein